MKSLLLDIAEVRMGYSFRSRLEVDAEGDVAVIQMKDIDDSNLLHPEGLARIQMPDLKDRHIVQEGDLMFRSRGESNSTSLVGGSLGRAVLAAPMMLIRLKVDAVEPAYLQWFINQPATQAALASQAAGTAVKMIGKAALEQLEVAVPPLDDQRRIVEIGQLAAREAQLMRELMGRRKALIEGILMRRAQDVR
ncbi:restriction endonuclease subunit S [Imbroritus primus]|uniref:Restriction endonuclease subunit S n=1 Tax=Imbroritus primus TaxID=3058603 RepID=A0ACD3SVK5_9BURK|nr:restriction endonuclease subunit S [Burkholderiaceae bacterium PBA]